MVSLRSLVVEITGVDSDDDSFESERKKIERIHHTFCKITGKDKEIKEEEKHRFVEFMKVFYEKLKYDDTGVKINAKFNKIAKDKEVNFTIEEVDKLSEWFIEANQNATDKDDLVAKRDLDVWNLNLENESLIEEIQQIFHDNMSALIELYDKAQIEDLDDFNILLKEYKEYLINPRHITIFHNVKDKMSSH